MYSNMDIQNDDELRAMSDNFLKSPKTDWNLKNTVHMNKIDTVPIAEDGKAFEPPKEDSTKALRYNDGKCSWSLVHYKSLEPMVRVLEFGAKKYAPNNWKKGLDLDKILESMQRHLAALMDGETVDAESGISHMGHIMCNAMFYNYHKEKQDGIKKGNEEVS